MIQSKKQMFLIVGIFALILSLTTISFAFFNYTRTGGANNFGTGRINFNSNQNNALNMTNVFPMTSEEAESANLDAVTISITGDTTYANGEEFEISFVDVTNTISGKEIPINYVATYEAATGETIGTSSNNYWDAREAKDSNIYTLTTTGEVKEGKQVLVGYIDNDGIGVNGILTIKVYIDADKVAISDTYNGPEATPNTNMGTTSEWVNGRTVFTTSEWRSLRTTPISFKIRTESNEGIWVENQLAGTIDSCQGCKFIYSTDGLWATWNTISETPTEITTDAYDSYLDVVSESGKNIFLGVKLNSSNQITNAYACGIKDGTPFCIEGTSDGTKYSSNKTFLNSEELYNNTCSEYLRADTGLGYDYVDCGEWNEDFSTAVRMDSDGFVDVAFITEGSCVVNDSGCLMCMED